jgi:hypothetical protein
MPRAVVFAPKLYQGIGFRHLYDLQGCDGTRLLLQELNQEKSTTQKLLMILLETIQLEAGIGEPILENCRPLDYIEWGWIPHIRDFLHHIHGKIIGATPKPSLYRENDLYLMDAPQFESFSRRDKIYIHRCRLHLQVETLSDITTASGSHIHHAWFHGNTEKPSTSTLRWPRQDSPSQPAWLAWKKFLYAISSPSGRLKRQLGSWVKPNLYRQYHAYIAEDDSLLMSDQQGHWETFTMEKEFRKSRTYLIWTRGPAQAPSAPATPTDVIHITDTRITVAAPSKWKSENKSKPTTATQWYKTSAPNTTHLIGNITMILEDDDITPLIHGKSIFEFASDGGHDPSTGISTFGWVASVNSTIIAQCRGPAQCHPSLAESFRAEGYGITSAGLFARNLINRFEINTRNHEWFFYLDNQSMIQRLSGYKGVSPSKWNLRPDEDITKMASLVITPIPHHFIHVKSHQDTSKNPEDLPFPAVLNIMADQQATRQKSLMTKPATEVQNISTAQLRIQGMCITRESQKWLLHTAGRIPIQNFYNDKYGWSETTFHSIAWDIQYAVLKSFSASDQARILKFVHGWLPTASRSHKEGSSNSPRCPICSAPREDNIHLFHCTNREMEPIQEKLQYYLVKDMHDKGDGELNNIIEMAILNSATNTWAPLPSSISRKWKTAVNDQSKIGWRHILCGRIAKSLINAMNRHYESQEISSFLYNGNRWAKKLLQNIWSIMLELWKTRNNIIYHTTQLASVEHLRAQLEPKVRSCYSWSHIIPARERNIWFSATIEDKLQEDPTIVSNWLQGASRIIKIAKREQRQRPKESAVMERFLNVSRDLEITQPRAALEIINPRAFPQELNPD